MTRKDYIKFANMIKSILDVDIKAHINRPYEIGTTITPTVSVSHIIEEMIKIFKNDNSKFSEMSFRNFIKYDTYQAIYNDKLEELAKKSWDIETQRKENIEYPKNNDKIFNVKTNKITTFKE